MAKTFDLKIAELERKKSELDLTFLQIQKKDCEDRMFDILDNQSEEIDESNAISQLNKIRSYRRKINEINNDIKNNPEILKKIDEKIEYYKNVREKLRAQPLYRNTQEWIAEIFKWDTIYNYAKEINDEELIKKLEQRNLLPGEYISILENEYPKYVANKRNEYVQNMENMYSELFAPLLKKKNKKTDIQQTEAQETPKVAILLPEWMSEQIKKDLKNDKDLKSDDIEKFLKNELKKNGWDIMLSHIKNTFKNKANQATRYIKKLISNYSWFKIIDNLESKTTVVQTKSKNEKLLSSITQEETEEHKNKRLKINNLTFKLNEIWKIEDLKNRITKYLDLFEELNYNFTNKEEFWTILYEVITIHTHIEIEKEIIKTLNLLIQWNLRIEKTWLYKYNVFRFNRDSRRMLAYPNWEIFAICPHEEYEKIINTQPPADKIE